MAARDPLAEYNRKRDFTKTAEPAGKRADTQGNSFIVQKHAATRLHWDFRLEADGVLKSWAVTKGPSLDPDNKRLAVRTEDHPLDYATFEGIIPQDEYGGGTVMLWDRGTWAPVEGKSWRDIDKGHLHFTLEGERMKGEWILVRLKGRPGERRENWLLRKVADEYSEEGDRLVEEALTSVVSGRSMDEISAGAAAPPSPKPKRQQKPAAKPARPRARKAAAAPAFMPPQLATLVDSVPTGNDWMHEIKFDGYRALVSADRGDVRVFTRTGQDWTQKFAPLAAAIAALDLPPCLIDGEIVANDTHGNPDFSTLQAVLKRGHGAQEAKDDLHFHAFDLLTLDGADLTSLTNLERKEKLADLLHDAAAPVHLADHVIGSGERLFKAMCDAGQEGIISKRIDAPYLSTRTKTWVKVKCTRRQEFVILGWKKSSAPRRPFASLLLGQYEGDTLVYKGNVGTGFNDETLADIAARLKSLVRDTAPAKVDRAQSRGVTWVEPELVAEIAFAEFTAAGSVRHASFLGLRGDKAARDVVPEVAEPAPPPNTSFPITNRDRVIFPESGYTKGELADYYAAVASLMLPFIADRPLSLVRCPQGRSKQCFFQKHDSGGFGPHIRHVPIIEKDGSSDDYLYVTDADGIMACVQMGSIELHGWGSIADRIEQPDRMIFDLDPDEGLDFGDVKRAAVEIRDRLKTIGLGSFAMLSGGKGIHVIAPLSPGHDWEAHKAVARSFADALAEDAPDRYTATMSKAKRKGRIFIDWLRNQRGSTAVAPYSVRARPGAPVAAPIDWSELEGIESAATYTIRDVATLQKRAGSKLLKGWGVAVQTLPDTVQ